LNSLYCLNHLKTAGIQEIIYKLKNPNAMKSILTALLMALGFASVFAQGFKPEIKENIPLDSIRLSDPASWLTKAQVPII
jgi:hypothetical protein